MAYLLGVFAMALVGLAWLAAMTAAGPFLGTLAIVVALALVRLPFVWLYRRVSYH